MKMKEWAICAVVIIFNDFTMWYMHGEDCTPQVTCLITTTNLLNQYISGNQGKAREN